MAALSSEYIRYTFCYVYVGSDKLYFSSFHYETYDDATDALEEFLRLCVLDGDEVSFSSILSFTLNVESVFYPKFFEV